MQTRNRKPNKLIRKATQFFRNVQKTQLYIMGLFVNCYWIVIGRGLNRFDSLSFKAIL